MRTNVPILTTLLRRGSRGPAVRSAIRVVASVVEQQRRAGRRYSPDAGLGELGPDRDQVGAGPGAGIEHDDGQRPGLQVHLARQAFLDFGKGRHPAGLNFGDCFSYALAKTTGEPLLFKGEDLRRTDIPSAL